MARSNVIQTNFTAGEVSPLMYGRVDISKYFNGAKKLQNMVVRPQGGAWRRSGTRFVNSTKDSTKRSMLVPFIFSDVQPYILEFGNLYIRVYVNGGVVESSPGVPLEIVTPWADTDLDGLYWTQSADVLYIAHPNFQQRKLERFSNTSWSLVLYSPNDGPYLDEDKSGIRLQIKNVVDVATLTISYDNATTTAIASAATFAAGDVGKYVEFLNPDGQWTLALVTAFTDTTHDSVTVLAAENFIYSNPAVTVTFSGGQIHFSGLHRGFTSSVIGKYVRLTASQAWYKITSQATLFDFGATAVSIVAYNTSTVTVTVSAGFVVGDVGKYVEYRDTDKWGLALITAFVDPGNVKVDVVDAIIHPNDAAKITFSGGAVHSDLSGVFVPRPGLHGFIRTDNGNWYKTTTYNNSSSWSATVVTLKAINYPSVTSILKDRSITGTVTATNSLFLDTDLNRWVRLIYGAEVVAAQVTDVISNVTVNVKLSRDIPSDKEDYAIPYDNGFSDTFRLGAWSDTTGWPAVVSFHEQRLVFAKTKTQPQTVWGSRSGDYEDMAPTDPDLVVLADSAYNYTIASNQVNPIVWMESGPAMVIGTIGAEFQLKATAINEPITPMNVDMKEQTHFGSVGDRPHRVGSAVLFLQRGGQRVREMVYDFTIDAFVSKDLSIISEHVLRQGLGGYRSASQQEPTTIVWYVLNDGTLAAMTYERDQEVVAWHTHVLGGGGFVESVASIPSIDGKFDNVYLIVRRTINGSTKRYIERIEVDFNSDRGDSQSDMFYVDCGLSYSGAPATTISGLDHLNGAIVQVLADGAFIGTRVVSSGSINIGTPASKVHVGFGAVAKVITLEPEGGSQAGTSQGKVKRINLLSIRVKDTMPFKIGAIGNDPLKVNQDDFTSMRTGDFRVSLEQAFGMGISYQLIQDEPYCMNITALMPQMSTNE